MNHFSDKVNLIWDIADTLRGPYRPPQYPKDMLSLPPTPPSTAKSCSPCPSSAASIASSPPPSPRSSPPRRSGPTRPPTPSSAKPPARASTTPPSSISTSSAAPLDNIAQDLLRYIRSFSPNVRAIFNSFGFDDQIAKLDKANRLFLDRKSVV